MSSWNSHSCLYISQLTMSPDHLFTMRTAAFLAVVLFVALFEFGFAGDSKSSEENKEKDCSCSQRTAFHNKNVQEIERRKREQEENKRIIEKQKREHEENKRIIEEQKKREHEENKRIIEEQKKREREENVRKYVKAHYCKQSKEGKKEYYQRICKKVEKSDEEYVERMQLVQSFYPGLDLWYDEEHLCYTNSYYSKVYSRKSSESEEQYYRRLLAKESFEDESNWARRVNVLRVLNPGLSLWYADSNYDKYTKHYYEIYYQLNKGEDWKNYIKRVFKKASGEDDANYWRRVKLVQKCHPEYKCWQKKKYFKQVGVCSCILEAKNEEELRKRIEAEKSGNSCKKSKLEAVTGFFKNLVKKDDSGSSSSSSEEN